MNFVGFSTETSVNLTTDAKAADKGESHGVWTTELTHPDNFSS